MRWDYEARLRLRRFAGVVVPVLLVPLAVWVYAVTPTSAVAAPSAGTGGGRSPVPQDTSLVHVTVLADGSFEVVETVRLAAPVVQVRLTPPDLAAAGTAFARAVPVWSAVEVVGDDEEVVPVPRLSGAVTVPLAAPTTTLQVRYVLSGAAVRTVPSPDGRALGALAPLADVAGLVVGFEVDGPAVRAVTCPRLPADRALCAVARGAGLVVDPQPFADALVLAQLDLGTS